MRYRSHSTWLLKLGLVLLSGCAPPATVPDPSVSTREASAPPTPSSAAPAPATQPRPSNMGRSPDAPNSAHAVTLASAFLRERLLRLIDLARERPGVTAEDVREATGFTLSSPSAAANDRSYAGTVAEGWRFSLHLEDLYADESPEFRLTLSTPDLPTGELNAVCTFEFTALSNDLIQRGFVRNPRPSPPRRDTWRFGRRSMDGKHIFEINVAEYPRVDAGGPAAPCVRHVRINHTDVSDESPPT